MDQKILVETSTTPLLCIDTITKTFCTIFFTFTFLFTIFSLLLHIITRTLKPHWLCSCHVCKSYLNKTWSKDFSNLCDWYTHLLRKSPTATVHVHVLGNVITANPKNVEHMLKTKFNNYPKGKPFSTLLGDLLGQGIFNVDGHHWQFQRKHASLVLGSVSIKKNAFELIANEIRSSLVPLLVKQELLDLQDVFRRFSFDNICKFSFGLDPECLGLSLPMSRFADAFDTASRLSAERALAAAPLIWKVKRFFNLGSEKKLRGSIKMVHKLAEEMINVRRNPSNTTTTTNYSPLVHKKNECPDLLSRFMISVQDEAYLRDIVISFLLAGRDTVASGLTSFFWLLSQHPEVESAIRNESDRVMGTNHHQIASFEQMRDMHYLNAAVHESLRLYPPVQFDSKFALEDDVLPDGTFVSAGTRVTYHQYAMGRMESIWGSDCLEFRPERWLKNGVFVPENPFKFSVFHAGSRVCLGKEMALVEMKSVVLALVRRFNIRVANPGQVPRFSPGLTATVSGGLPVVIEERKDSDHQHQNQ